MAVHHTVLSGEEFCASIGALPDLGDMLDHSALNGVGAEGDGSEWLPPVARVDSYSDRRCVGATPRTVRQLIAVHPIQLCVARCAGMATTPSVPGRVR